MAIDKAIAAAQQQLEADRFRVSVVIDSTKSTVLLDVPKNITDQEIMELTAWILNILPNMIRQQSKIIIPNAM